MVRNALSAPEIRNALLTLIDHFQPNLNGDGKTNFYKIVTEKLNASANAKWTHRYIQSVSSGTINGSQALGHACLALGYEIDGAHPLLAKAHQAQLMVVGNVHEGAVILADNRPCDYPPCPVQFVPVVPHQRHCCREHQVKNYYLKKKLERGTV